MKQLNFMTSLSRTGYGIAGLNIAMELDKLCDLYIHPHGSVSVNNEAEAKVIKRACDKGRLSFPYDAPCLNLWHQNDLGKHVGRGPLYAYPFFELDTFKAEEKHHLNYIDGIMVSSQWAADIVNKEIGKPAHIVQPGVDTNIFFPGESLNNGKYVFFNAGKWEKRKGHDFLARAFDMAFERDDDVQLVMFPYNPFLTSDEVQTFKAPYERAKLKDKIVVLPPVQRHQDVGDIMRKIDCGVFPSRAEGWNMELLEVMACGKPVIATNYSAHTEYCTKENSYLIEIEGVEKAYDSKWFFGDGNWAEIEDEQIDQLVEHMRYCYKERPDNQAGINTAKELSWTKTAQKIAAHIAYNMEWK